VLGISVDSVYSHQAFAEQLGGLTFPLLADFHPKGALTQAYGLWRDDRGYGQRAIILLDDDGRVCYSEVIPRGAPDVEKILSIVKGLRQR
jgi:peroxiredoxin